MRAPRPSGGNGCAHPWRTRWTLAANAATQGRPVDDAGRLWLQCSRATGGVAMRISTSRVIRPGGDTRRCAAVLMLALLLAGCTVQGRPSSVGASAGRNATIAFESVDGPPARLYETLVSALAEEATARRLQVVSRNAAAEYRIRIYLAPQVEGRQSRVAWVWDVYKAAKQRA